MTKAQKLKGELEEARAAFNKVWTDAAKFDEALFATVRRLEKEYGDVFEDEARTIERSVTGADAGQHRMASLDPETREAVRITETADLGVMVGNILSHRNTGGAEAEAQAAWGIQGNQIPLAMLTELRATDAPANSGSSQPPVLAYQFPASIGEFANIGRPRVPAGQHVYPSITGASVAGRPAEAGVVATSDATLRGELISPSRVQAWTTISVEDRAKFDGLGAAVAAHLAGAVAKGYDDQALSAFFLAANLTEPNAPGAASTYANYASGLHAGVDGRYAPSTAMVKLLIGEATYTDGAEIYRVAQSTESIMDRIARISGGLMVSDTVPAAAANIQNALLIRGMGQMAVQPLWDGLSLEDMYSESDKGEVKFTMVGLSGFSIQQPSAYAWQKYNLS